MANIDWSKLTFSYTKTNTILTCMFRDGKWGEIESHTNDDITISSFAGALHYSIECFEGLKAFRNKDGRISIFRPDENIMADAYHWRYRIFHDASSPENKHVGIYVNSVPA